MGRIPFSQMFSQQSSREQAALNNRVEALMSKVDDLIQNVADETTVVQSAVTLLNGLSAQLQEAGTDPAKLAQLQAGILANKSLLAQAVSVNTPAAPGAPAADTTSGQTVTESTSGQ